MSDTIRPLIPGRDENAVEVLREWLKDAEEGRLVGVVLLGNLRGAGS